MCVLNTEQEVQRLNFLLYHYILETCINGFVSWSTQTNLFPEIDYLREAFKYAVTTGTMPPDVLSEEKYPDAIMHMSLWMETFYNYCMDEGIDVRRVNVPDDFYDMCSEEFPERHRKWEQEKLAE